MKLVIRLVLLLSIALLALQLGLQGPDDGSWTPAPEGAAEMWLRLGSRVNELHSTLRMAWAEQTGVVDAGAGDEPRVTPPQTYYRWQDDDGVWHFSDEAPAHLDGQLEARPLPEASSYLREVPPDGSPPDGSPPGGMAPTISSSIDAPSPAGSTRPAADEPFEKEPQQGLE